MKKNKRILVLGMLMILVIQILIPVRAHAKSAFNFYSDPYIPKDSSGKYNTFLIDFRASKDPEITYWELCGWYMDITELKKSNYKVMNSDDDNEAYGMGAYAGFQNIEKDGGTEKVAIMSFWECRCIKNEGDDNVESLRASCLYPEKEGDFGGEGER